MEQWSEAAQNQVSDLKIHFYAPETRIAAQALAKTWKCDMSAKRQSSCERKQGRKHFPFRRDWKSRRWQSITLICHHHNLGFGKFEQCFQLEDIFNTDIFIQLRLQKEDNRRLNWRGEATPSDEKKCNNDDAWQSYERSRVFFQVSDVKFRTDKGVTRGEGVHILTQIAIQSFFGTVVPIPPLSSIQR